MTTYAIGDVQGCFHTLQRLVARLGIDPARDRVWLVGDLVNRGPGSLGVIRWASTAGAHIDAVLGNHDLYALARYYGVVPKQVGDDTLDALVDAPDAPALFDWFAKRRLLAEAEGILLVHAGLIPEWTKRDALAAADAVHQGLKGPERVATLQLLAKRLKAPKWRTGMAAPDRLMVAAAILTRIRMVDADGDFMRFKGAPKTAPAGLAPWFSAPNRQWTGTPIVHGHWARLGLHQSAEATGLDTGCVYGKTLTALRLSDGALFAEPCAPEDQPREK